MLKYKGKSRKKRIPGNIRIFKYKIKMRYGYFRKKMQAIKFGGEKL